MRGLWGIPRGVNRYGHEDSIGALPWGVGVEHLGYRGITTYPPNGIGTDSDGIGVEWGHKWVII